MNYQEQHGILKRIVDLKEKGMKNRAIAKLFNKEGMHGPTGRPVCPASISHFMIENGIRTHKYTPKKTKRTYTKQEKSPDNFMLDVIASKELTRDQKLKVLQALL